MSINTGGARVTGRGPTLVQIHRAETSSEARGTETVEGAGAVHTLGLVLTAVTLTVVDVLVTELACSL